MRGLLVTWKEVIGYEGLYEVSDEGEIRGLPKVVVGNHLKPTRNIPARTKKQSLLVGYPAVTLFKDGKPKLIKVHRLVAEAFLSNDDNLPIVNHIDNDKTNNKVSNLEWCTALHNSQHMMKQGRHNFAHGERSSTAKLTNEQVIEIRSMAGNYLQKEIGAMYGVNQQCISSILKGDTWKHIL